MTFERVRLIEELLAEAFAGSGEFSVGVEQGERIAYVTSWREDPYDEPTAISRSDLARDVERRLTADGRLS